MCPTPTILNLRCLRHGKTQYTGEYPDLTQSGVRDTKLITRTHIAGWLHYAYVPHEMLSIMTSPAPRSQGTADVIAEEIGYDFPLKIEPMLDAMQWRDPHRCKNALNGLSGIGYIDYETEPIFANPELFETPVEMRQRWYAFFQNLITKAMAGEVRPYGILVSHYEVLCHIVSDLFDIVASEETALRHTEPVALIVREYDTEQVIVSGTFRGMNRIRLFDLQKHVFA